MGPRYNGDIDYSVEDVIAIADVLGNPRPASLNASDRAAPAAPNDVDNGDVIYPASIEFTRIPHVDRCLSVS